MTKGVVVFLALAIALVGCEPSEFKPVPVPAGGGQAPPASQPVRPAEPLAPGAQHLPMLQDPEGNLEDESITIYADSAAAALKQCEQTATNRSDSKTIVTCLGCRLMTSPGTGRYACTLRIEARKP